MYRKHTFATKTNYTVKKQLYCTKKSETFMFYYTV